MLTDLVLALLKLRDSMSAVLGSFHPLVHGRMPVHGSLLHKPRLWHFLQQDASSRPINLWISTSKAEYNYASFANQYPSLSSNID